MQGGAGGQPWSDASVHTLLPIRGIRINFGGGIDRIQVGAIENSNELSLLNEHQVLFGANTWGPSHGVARLQEDLFSLQEDEFITKIEGRSGSHLVAIQFFTNTGLLY